MPLIINTRRCRMLRVQQNATSVNDTFVTVQCHGYEKQRKAELRVMTIQECYKKMGAACGHTGRLKGMVWPCDRTVQHHDRSHPRGSVTQAAPTVFRPPCALIQKAASTDAKESNMRCFCESIYEILLKIPHGGGNIILYLCRAVPMPFCGIRECRTTAAQEL